LAYNQESFIREAIEGAISQSYENLEIILSDDCSNDSTFEIMCGVAKNYTGPHKIILNKNESNLGIGQHINVITNISSGGLIVLNAGDDISLPTRVQEYAKVWMNNNLGNIAIHSNANLIDRDSNILKVIKPNMSNFSNDISKHIKNSFLVLGCTQAYSKGLFEKFDDINANIVAEDIIITLRALSKDGVYHIDKVLLNYRIGGVSGGYLKMSWNDEIELMNKNIQRRLDGVVQMITDLRTLNYGCTVCNLLVDRYNRSIVEFDIVRGSRGIIYNIINYLLLGGGFKQLVVLLLKRYKLFYYLFK